MGLGGISIWQLLIILVIVIAKGPSVSRTSARISAVR